MTEEQKQFIASIKKPAPRDVITLFFAGRSIKYTMEALELSEKQVKNYRDRYLKKMIEAGIYERVSKPKQRWLAKQTDREAERVQHEVELLIKFFDGDGPDVCVSEFSWNGDMWRVTTRGILAKTKILSILSIYNMHNTSYTINGTYGPISKGVLPSKQPSDTKGLISKLGDDGESIETWNLELNKEGEPIYHGKEAY